MIHGNTPLTQKRINTKKSYSDYQDLRTYVKGEFQFYLEDLGNSIDTSKAREAFGFLNSFEKSDQFTKEALRGGYSSAENVLIDIQEKIEVYKQNENKKNNQDNKDRLKASDQSKEIWDNKISQKFKDIEQELLELHKMTGFRSYMVEDQFDDALISLSKSAKILINKPTLQRA